MWTVSKTPAYEYLVEYGEACWPQEHHMFFVHRFTRALWVRVAQRTGRT